jgi:hypothetical protein
MSASSVATTKKDRVNYRADDPESRENVGLKDLRFGVIGLGTCAGLAILFAIIF